MSLLPWLFSQSEKEKFYFRCREIDFEIAGVGIREMTDDFAKAQQWLVDGDSFFFSFVPFEERFSRSSLWDDFRLKRYVRTKELKAQKREIDAQHSSNYQWPRVISQGGTHQNDWCYAVEKALQLLRQKELQKVVLAAQKEILLEQEPDLYQLINKLRTRQHASVFMMQSAQKKAFFGASPEVLFVREGNHVMTEAQAGTRRLAQDAEENERLQRELFNSQKEGFEHRIVVDQLAHLVQTLAHENPRVFPTHVVKLKNVQHLRTEISANLPLSVRDDEILNCLHPTSAVSGFARDKALHLIRELERFDRGYYAGVVGVMGREHTECAVAIRSALISERTVHAFAGAGIVADSEANAEWEEVQLKMTALFE